MSVTDMKSLTGEQFDNRNGEDVTDVKNDAGDAFDSRNAQTDRTAAKIGALFAAADPRTDEEKQASRLIRESVKAAAVCGKCGNAIEPADTVYRRRVTTRGFCLGSHGSTVVVVCHDCIRGSLYWMRFSDPQPCEQCKRPVIEQVFGPFRRATYVLCSERCRAEFYRNLGIQRTREARAKRKPAMCEICKQSFTPKRGDAKHCSPACKQKAYRLRQNKSGKEYPFPDYDGAMVK